MRHEPECVFFLLLCGSSEALLEEAASLKCSFCSQAVRTRAPPGCCLHPAAINDASLPSTHQLQECGRPALHPRVRKCTYRFCFSSSKVPAESALQAPRQGSEWGSHVPLRRNWARNSLERSGGPIAQRLERTTLSTLALPGVFLPPRPWAAEGRGATPLCQTTEERSPSEKCASPELDWSGHGTSPGTSCIPVSPQRGYGRQGLSRHMAESDGPLKAPPALTSLMPARLLRQIFNFGMTANANSVFYPTHSPRFDCDTLSSPLSTACEGVKNIPFPNALWQYLHPSIACAGSSRRDVAISSHSRRIGDCDALSKWWESSQKADLDTPCG